MTKIAKTENLNKQLAEHTPLPWIEDGWAEYDRVAKLWVFSLRVSGLPIVKCYGDSAEKAEANARLIVKAVNNHEKLVEALNLIAETCGVVNYSSHNQMREAIESAMSIAEELLATLKKAE